MTTNGMPPDEFRKQFLILMIVTLTVISIMTFLMLSEATCEIIYMIKNH